MNVQKMSSVVIGKWICNEPSQTYEIRSTDFNAMNISESFSDQYTITENDGLFYFDFLKHERIEISAIGKNYMLLMLPTGIAIFERI